MTRNEATAELIRGIAEDVRDYRLLQLTLEQQFEAALSHQTMPLSALAERIGSMTAKLEQRRARRLALATALGGKGISIHKLLSGLPATRRQPAELAWSTLEDSVLECKKLNERNGRLIMDQFSIMQRVLNGEQETYAPL